MAIKQQKFAFSSINLYSVILAALLAFFILYTKFFGQYQLVKLFLALLAVVFTCLLFFKLPIHYKLAAIEGATLLTTVMLILKLRSTHLPILLESSHYYWARLPLLIAGGFYFISRLCVIILHYYRSIYAFLFSNALNILSLGALLLGTTYLYATGALVITYSFAGVAIGFITALHVMAICFSLAQKNRYPFPLFLMMLILLNSFAVFTWLGTIIGLVLEKDFLNQLYQLAVAPYADLSIAPHLSSFFKLGLATNGLLLVLWYQMIMQMAYGFWFRLLYATYQLQAIIVMIAINILTVLTNRGLLAMQSSHYKIASSAIFVMILFFLVEMLLIKKKVKVNR